MATRLTEISVRKALPPETGQVEYWDATIPGFGLRVSTAGTKSWVLLYRHAGRPRRLTLGRYPTLGLPEARAAAREALRMLEHGRDPATVKAEQARRDQQDTFDAVVGQFIEKYAKPKNRSWAETDRLLRRELASQWGRRPIGSITRRDLNEALDAIVERGSPVVANRTLAAARKLFAWAVEREIIRVSPAAGLQAPARVESRDRVLADVELLVLWRCWESWPFGPLFRLLLLTGQREGEVARMRWSDLDLGGQALWVLPRETTKAGRQHVVPLPDPVRDLLRDLPRVDGSKLVFPSQWGGDRPVSGFSKAKARTDKLSGVTDWRLHDLRRTAASGMAKLGVAPHVIEKILNHSTGTISGVAAIYNRHAYLDEMRHALVLWADHVLGLTRAQ